MKWIKRLFCRHVWKTEQSSKNHNIVDSRDYFCIKCGKVLNMYWDISKGKITRDNYFNNKKDK